MATTTKAAATVKRKRAPRGESLTSPRRVRAITEKQLGALEYRKMGYTFAQIAEAVGFNSAQSAHEAVKSALLKVIREPAEDVLKLELERLDAMFVPAYAGAIKGDLLSISSALAIMGRKARLLGLDAPVKQALSGPDGGPMVMNTVTMSPDQMDAALARVAEKY